MSVNKIYPVQIKKVSCRRDTALHSIVKSGLGVAQGQWMDIHVVPMSMAL